MFSCLFSIDTYVWKFFKMLCFKILLFFMFFFLIVIVLSLFLTQTTKCSRIPTLKAREIFGNHYVLVFFVCLFLFFFNVTRVQGSFLDLSALKIKTDDQHWPFKGARVQSKLARSFTMWKKFRLHAFTFSNIIYSITCYALLNKIYVSESVTSLRRQVSKEMTRGNQNLHALF